MTERKMTLGGKDKATQSLASKRQGWRDQKKVDKKAGESSILIWNPVNESLVSDDDEGETVDNPPSSDNEYAPSPKKKKKKIEKREHLVVDRNAIESTMRTAISLDISAHKLTATLTKLVTSAKGDPSNLPLSYTSSFRMKDKIMNADSANLKILIKNEIKKHGQAELHFDGKLIRVSKHQEYSLILICDN